MEKSHMLRPNYLRAELARRELEKSSIITSIAAPGTSSMRIQRAIGRYVELDVESREILARLQRLEGAAPVGSPANAGTMRGHHRLNKDGTYDSICRFCFTTIATVRHESDLDELERDHTCDPGALRRYYTRPS
jgi:hypothetical protein